jgi:hypothetical protein
MINHPRQPKVSNLQSLGTARLNNYKYLNYVCLEYYYIIWKHLYLCHDNKYTGLKYTIRCITYTYLQVKLLWTNWTLETISEDLNQKMSFSLYFIKWHHCFMLFVGLIHQLYTLFSFGNTVKPLYYGHPRDWQLLSLIERRPDYRGQNE